MKHQVLIAAPGRDVEAVLAAQALAKAAREAGLEIDVHLESAGDAPAAPALLVGAPDHPQAAQAAQVVALDAVLADPAAALALLSAQPNAAQQVRVVAITSCPTGIAHTFMAAEGLQQGAAELGHAIRVETQGSVGAGTPLTAQEIAEAHVVIIAADREVDRARFAGKRVFASNTKPAITGGAALITRALAEASVQAGGQTAGAAPAKAERTGPYKHLMTGVSFMLPFVVAGGLLIALAFALGGIHANDDAAAGTLAHTLFEIGAKGGFALIVPALAGYIAYSIADRPGIAPGMIGGMIAASQGAGFLGGIVAGFIAGYGVEALNRAIRLPRNLAGLKPMLILPLLGTLITGLLMVYAVGTPVAAVLSFLTQWLRGMQGSSAIALGLILGAMMAFDMGGPVNKASYAFSVGLIASQVYTPMAATMAAGMTPPLGIALATVLFRNRFSAEERDGAGATAVLGLAFITEGAIPFAARDPLRMIPAFVAGSALAGAISMAMGVELRVPHGGVFVLPIPGAVTHLGAYALAIAAGTLTTALLAGLLRRPLPTTA
ncbi:MULTISPECIES: fructose-specific PTS transporter subunit EIIC [unclassified Novosphingobium]|uniref:PTS fructose transporter subunit IIC n=1 Tax=unclassified Novosphingobium TaxID=2644732 RepID=UPI00146D0469|nr:MULTISPECIES: fructose-specific PTS transporter subunit EIIC [unclassified Novosphingobium]NMN05075.1 PTS system fructose-specific IIC component [Novosphingobium sp. SG919]NMN87370.1 PTS system fructose-specific IIC component [Novosphingobium sp. SG916]